MKYDRSASVSPPGEESWLLGDGMDANGNVGPAASVGEVASSSLHGPLCCSGLLRATLTHPLNVRVVLMMVALNLVCAFYLQTMGDQMGLAFSKPTAEWLGAYLQFGFPMLGFVASIVASRYVFERRPYRESACWVWPASLGIAFSVLQAVLTVAPQFAAATLFGPMRTLQWACYFNSLAVAPRYCPQLAGRILGYNNVVIALL